MKAQYIFPVILILLDIGAGIVYATQGDFKKTIYWVAAAVLNAAVTFQKGVLKMESILTQEQIDSLFEAIQILADAIAEVAHRLADAIAEIIGRFVQDWDDLILNSGTGKIKHLVLHAKKKRTRKKNFHRLQKRFLKLLSG